MIIPFIAIILYLLGNWYSYSRFMDYFNLEHNLFSIIILFFLILSMPLGMIISKYTNKRYFLYKIGTNWFGILIILLFFTVLTDLINLFYYNKYNYYYIFFIFLLTIIFGYINAIKIYIKKIKLKGNFNLNIVFISDIHMGEICGGKKLNNIVNKINSLNPDVVMIGGDFFDGGKEINDNELKPLNKIKVPIFMSMGNHDFYYDEEKVKKQLSKYVKILRNEKISFKNIDIIGIDDQKIKLLENIKHNQNSILIYHRPFGLKYFNKSNAFLMLCGHTHNGQFFPLFINFIFKYPYGLYKLNKKYLYTSSGVVGWGPRIRLGSINEIVNIKIEKK